MLAVKDVKTEPFVICQGPMTIVKPPIIDGGALCKGVAKLCCLDARFALPCDEEVPFQIGLFFVICLQGKPAPWHGVEVPEGANGKCLFIDAPKGSAPGNAEMARG